MEVLMVCSCKAYSGKSGVCAALVEELTERGRSTAYFKPFGTMPVAAEGVVTDRDALWVNSRLPKPGPVDSVCPVVCTRALLESALDGSAHEAPGRVAAAFSRIAEGADTVVVEGPSGIFEGRSLGIDAASLAVQLDARVILIDRPEGCVFPDDVLGFLGAMDGRLGGVLVNWVRPPDERFITEKVLPFLEGEGVRVYGVMPYDTHLASVRVVELAEALGARVVSGADHLDGLVEAFMVGAMGQEKALRFFRRKAAKAVITGADRSDVQLAALETDTRCLVLTGGTMPVPRVLDLAQERGIPVLLVDYDTLTAVERMEGLLGRVRLHDPGKVARIRRMLAEHADLPGMLGAS